MNYKILATVQADADLEHLMEYLVNTLQNPVAAQNLLNGIDDCYEKLSRMPCLYEQCRSSRLKALGYRKAVIHQYIMVYRMDEDEKTVYVLRYFHGKQDYERLL